MPGIAWSIGNATETLAEGGVGLGNSPATPMGAATRCALASVSKQFAVASIYMLRDEGKLSLDAPLAAYLPAYRDASKVTLRQLLTMSSGISADTDACEAPVGGRLDDTALIENLNRMALEFPPGAHFAYSNCAYDVAGAVVAKLSGMPFAHFVEARIFKPLGMASSYQLGTRADSDFAEGYSWDGKGWKPAPAMAADRVFASGNLALNPGDMERWDRALLNATLPPRKTLDEMFTVDPLSSGARRSMPAAGSSSPTARSGMAGRSRVTVRRTYWCRPAATPWSSWATPTRRDRWRPWDVARKIYNEAKLGPPCRRSCRSSPHRSSRRPIANPPSHAAEGNRRWERGTIFRRHSRESPRERTCLVDRRRSFLPPPPAGR